MNPIPLATAAVGRDNNFLLIRMVLAALVAFSHSYTFTHGDEHLEPLFQLTTVPFGYVSVDIFFLMSGFLITQSWMHRQDLASFTMARASRIFPALWVNIVFILIVSAFITTLPLGQFLTHPDTWIWTAKNTVMFFGSGGDLPGDFVNNPHPTWTNIPLWTLPWELQCYTAIAVLGFVGSFRRPKLLLAFSSIIFSLHLYNNFFDVENWTSNFRFPSMFAIGMCFYTFRDKITLRWSGFSISALALFLCLWLSPNNFEWLYPILLPYFVFCAVFLPGGWLRRYNRCGDYSYGLYIYGGFIGQVVAMKPGIGLAEHLFVTMILTLGLAYLSWNLVESRVLQASWRQPATDWIRRRLPQARPQAV